ncbi:MAG: hypothetical protein ACMXYL_01335 [Candidatus Woesearchaeota archaeon]
MVFYPKRSDDVEVHTETRKLLDDHVELSEVRKSIDSKYGGGKSADTLKDFDKKSSNLKKAIVKKNNKILGSKETLDKISFGIGNLQFINILYYILLPSYLFIGLFLALRSYIVYWVEERAGKKDSFTKLKDKTYWYGALLGYMFIFAACAVTFNSYIAYTLVFLGIGVLGSLYMSGSVRISYEAMPRDKKSHYLKWISYYGLPLTAIVMVLAGIIIDTMQMSSQLVIGGMTVQIYGYAILFFMAGILIIISSYLQSSLKRALPESAQEHETEYHHKALSRDPFITSLLIAGILFFSLQTSFNYILGLYLYETYKSFTFVGLLLAATLLAAFLSPLFFDKSSIKKSGKSYILLLGTGLAIFLPLLFAISTNESLSAIMLRALESVGLMVPGHTMSFLPLFYLIIGITGASIAGIAYSRITRELLQHDDREEFSRKLGSSTGIGTALTIILLFGLRHFTGEFWTAFLAATILYIITATLFASIVSVKSEQEYQKRRFESKIAHNKV